MKKKIIIIVSCMLLIVGFVNPVIGFASHETSSIQITTNTLDQGIIQQSNLMTGWSQMAKLMTSDAEAGDGCGCAVAIDGDYALVCTMSDDSNRGAAYVFHRSATSWTQQAKLTASDGIAGDLFGFSGAINADYSVIGASGDDSSRGSAYIFYRSGTSWTQQAKLTASDAAINDNFGYSVSISGDYALIGAPADDSEKGSAYVFHRSGTSWTQQAKLTASDGEIQDLFGFSVSIDGDYALIGAYAHNLGQGTAYVFKRTDTSWAQQAKITASDGAIGDVFGHSVSIKGEYCAIGAVFDDDMGFNAGSGYVFHRSGTTWTQQAKLLATDGAANDYFGFTVSITNGYVVLGAYADDASRGSAYVFQQSGTSWTQETKLTASDGATNDLFGYSASISGYYILLGSPQNDNTHGSNAGAAYVFNKPIPDLDCSGTLSWTQVKPGETKSGSFFIANIGDPTSQLSWTVESYPTWGTWSFTPASGTGLTPEMGAITIAVEVTAPNENNQQFTGEIKIVNTEDTTDYDTISVSLTTPVCHSLFFEHFFVKFFERFPAAFPLLRLVLTC